MSETPYITEGARHGLHTLAWSFVVLFVIDFLLTAAILVYLARQVKTVSASQAAVARQEAGSCAFFRDLASAPVTLNPATRKPSLLGVELIADSRTAYRGLGCQPALGPAAPSFRDWAPYFHLAAS